MEWSLVDGHLTISGEITHTSNNYSDWPWYYQKNTIQSVSFSNAYFTSGSNAYGMFYSCTALTSLNLSSFDTSNVTSMSEMFYYCIALTSLDLSSFDTSNVTDMSEMFDYCSSLISLDLSNFNTSNVTNMSDMFHSCTALTSLDLSNFDTSNVTNMNYMFYLCRSLISLDLSSFDTSNVTDMSEMFARCRSLTSLDLSNFDTSNITDMRYMFENCDSLTSLDLSSFDTSNVTTMNQMFYHCIALTSLDLSNFNTSKVIYMIQMFYSCSSLISLDLSNFNTSKVIYMGNMFDSCSNLISLNLSSFDTSKVTDMDRMFEDCINLQYIRISNLWTTNEVRDSSNMFYNCTGLPNYDGYTDKRKAYAGSGGYLSDDVCACYNPTLHSLTFEGCYKNQYYNIQTIDGNTYYVGFETTQPDWNNKPITTVNFNIIVKPETTFAWFNSCVSLTTINNLQLLNTSNVTRMSQMFNSCFHLTSLDLSSFDTSKVEYMSYMFFGCTALTSLNLSSFDTSNVTDMNHMFGSCYALTLLDLSNFNTSNVTNMSSMFSGCTALTLLDLSNFDTSNVTNMSDMFNSCTALTSLDLSNFDLSSATNLNYMFQKCSATIPVLYVRRAQQCTAHYFADNSQGTIYLVRDPAVAENTVIRDFWRSVANSYNNVHFEYDDATRPTVTPEISRGKLVNNQWQADELGNTIKIKLNEQVYNNNTSLVLPENKMLISYEEVQNPTGNPSEQGWYEKNNEEYIQTSDTQVTSGKTYYNKNTGVNIEIPTAVNYVVKQDLTNDLFYITLNTDSDKQYDVNVILTDLSGIPGTRVVIAPGVFAMIEFRAGGHGMSIGKICEQDGLEVDIPTAIGEKLLLPTNNNTIDLTKNQLVIGQYNRQENDALFIIGNGNQNYRHNILEVYENEIHLTNGDSYTYNFTKLSDISLDDTIIEVNNLDSNNFYLDNVKGLTSGAASYHVNSGKSQTSLKISLSERTTISFSTYVSSESGFDFGAIYIGPQNYSPTVTQIKNGTVDASGGQYIYRKSGNQSLEEVSTILEPGEYYISFIYAKDSSSNSNDDRFYIKSMIFQEDIEMATTFTIDNNNISLNSAGDLITPTMAGQIIMFGGATSKIPLGWLPCDGSSVLIADYPLLAAALYDGSVYVWGQVDSTHFNLPDLRGRAPIGVNGDAAATGLTARTVGTKNIGEETHTLKAAEAAQKAVSTNGMSANASHNHEMGYKVADRGSGSTDTRMGPYGHTTSGVTVINTASTSVAHTHSITGSDATTGHNNMQPSAVVNFIICTGQIPQ